MKLRNWIAKMAAGTGDDAQTAAAVLAVFESVRGRMMTLGTVDQWADGLAPPMRDRVKDLLGKYEDYLSEGE